MYLLAMWFPSVGMFGVVLAVIGGILSIIAFTGWRRIVLALTFAVLGIGELVSIQRADTAHQVEVHNQHEDIEKLSAELQKSETQHQVDAAYLRAKLEDYAQFGPALMKLAETSAEFQRKQYETKVQTDKELYEFTMGVVNKTRILSAKYSALSQQQLDDWMNIGRSNTTDAAKRQAYGVLTSNQLASLSNRDSEFRSSIWADAIYARNELRKRHIAEPQLDQMNKSLADSAFMGILAGPTPELSLALYLETMVRGLKH